MRKVKVLPELYLANSGLYYVVSEYGVVYCATDGMTEYIQSALRLDDFNMLRFTLARIKMRWIHVDQ